MERALNLTLLSAALDGTANLPTPEELRVLLANAEVDAYFAGSETLDPVLLETAWNLHHVGTVRPALELYGTDRQVQANSVAAHIFDLALRNEELTPGARLVLTFAAQVSSIRGDRTPNASALARRLPIPTAQIAYEPGRASLELGCSLLSLNRAETMSLVRALATQLREVQQDQQADAPNRVFAAVIGVVDGCRLLLRYLTNGNPEDLTAARTSFQLATNSVAAQRDLDSRWVAAHLLDLCDDLGNSSVWAILPVGTPPAVAQAMTLGDPPVMTLWPPQVALLSDTSHSPLRFEVKRSVLTFPTSAGKTLLTQLVIANHLATRGTGVCVVAPSHSLCREIREGLDRRLWVIRRSVAEDGPLGDPEQAHAPVVVMTPERLAARLRASEADLLNEFELFVLDEAHLVADGTRGWSFETTVARLHQLTGGSPHRLVLVSAALGGTASVQTWLDMDAAPNSTVARWRGPRRLHATYTPRPDPTTRRTVPPTGKQKKPRIVTDLKGVVQLFVDQGAAVATRAASLGETVRVGKTTEAPSRAEQLRPVVDLATRSGSVLTVHATKKNAETLAAVMASTREPREAASSLVRLAELRLGVTHPLVDVLRKGVAYHHAALPVDIQVEIENSVRSGAIDIVCATTTLAEGVNLPVRTVIICERGYYDGSEFHELIGDADLLNAAGRAGRAGRETEGWIVVAHQWRGPDPREALLSIDRDHDIRSTLDSSAALAALAEYEAVLSTSAEIVLSDVPPAVDAFLAYCWYLADAADLLGPLARAPAVISGIQNTLAWHQLPQVVRGRWEALALRLVDTYAATDVARRRRWARSGARLSANAVLEEVAHSFGEAADDVDPLDSNRPLFVLDLLLSDGRLEKLLGLVDERDRRFKKRRYGATQLIQIDLKALILDWVAGVDLADLAERYLSEIEGDDEDAFRFEQLSTFLARVCEHHLPWTAGTVLEWVKSDPGVDLSPSLPAYVHYGVSSPVALQLMTAGVRSRRIAVIVGEAAHAASIQPDHARSWLARLGPSQWRTRFDAGASEVADLLQFSRNPSADTSALLLDGQAVSVSVTVEVADAPAGVQLEVDYAASGDRPRPLALLTDARTPVAVVSPDSHHDLALLVDAGFRLLGELSESETGDPVALVRVDPE
jgi:hypothetical protein